MRWLLWGNVLEKKASLVQRDCGCVCVFTEEMINCWLLYFETTINFTEKHMHHRLSNSTWITWIVGWYFRYSNACIACNLTYVCRQRDRIYLHLRNWWSVKLRVQLRILMELSIKVGNNKLCGESLGVCCQIIHHPTLQFSTLRSCLDK